MRLAITIALIAALVAPASWAAYDARIEAAQRALIAQGFDPGPADGLMGRRTRAALRAFQTANALPASGRVDPATAIALGLSPAPHAAPETAPPASAAAPAPTQPPAPAPDTPARLAPTRAPDLLAYARLGWTAPGAAASVRARSRKATGITDARPLVGNLVVSDVGQVYLIGANEQLEGDACKPGAGSPTMEFLVGPDGPIAFSGSRAAPLCQLGTGVVLREGSTLEMVETWWGETRIRAGRVRVGGAGLEYVR
jgi:hypothetical protein